MNMQGKVKSCFQEHAHPIREERQARDQPCSGLVLRGRGPLHLPPAQGHPHRRRALHRREQDQVWQVLVIKIVSVCLSLRRSFFFRFFSPPTIFLCLTSTNHLLLGINASVNFIIYCSCATRSKSTHCILNKLVAQRAEKISGKILPSPGSRAASGTL